MAGESLGWRIPERIGRLEELAHNLWWSWQPEARELFRNLNYVLWRIGGHNPVKQLRQTSPERLQQIAADSHFLALYDAVMAKFDAEVMGQRTWFGATYPDLLKGPVAYFFDGVCHSQFSAHVCRRLGYPCRRHVQGSQ